MAQPYRSIGQVLSAVKPEYSDISISKIRYLESEGLISPERAPSGYRRYTQADIERLRYVLSAQKNHYLPLKVIREHLEMIDQGMDPPSVEPVEPIAAPHSGPGGGHPQGSETANAPERLPSATRPLKLTRAQLLERSGLPESTMVELERHQVLRPRRGTAFYGWEALTVAIVARKLGPFGMDARHLRAVKMAAEREIGLIEQAVAPYSRRREVARRTTIEVADLILHAHAALMQTALDQ
ncbi:MAG: MerR family transcriptional regulator [Propionibacteriaceae bacterium]|jgi:DNA-binding transcriptional MerR regulator|nr:MerR family transcriptional regulator [Propionibacteriaceae bacterium]